MRWTIAAACCLCLQPGGVSIGTSSAFADDVGESRSAEAVLVEHCRIKFVQRATLAAGQVGVLRFVGPQEGDRVKKGDKVAAIADEVPVAQLAVARKEQENDIDVRYAQKAAKLAKVELEKVEAANREVAGAVPDIEVLRLKLAFERSELQAELAQHQAAVKKLNVNQAEAELIAYGVEAPFDGVVTQVAKHQGEAVRQGDAILEIVNPDRIRAEGSVPLKDAWRIKRGDPVIVHLDPELEKFVRTSDGETPEFEGTVIHVGVDADPVSGKVRVWAEVTNRDGILRSGLITSMRILPKPSKAQTDN